MQLTFEQSASPEFLDLMWSTFFRDRGRGRSISEHFPWMSDLRGAGAWLATIQKESSQPVAGLVVKRHSQNPDSASIGLVCVREDLRGQGLSQSLLSGAIREAQALGIKRLTLWSGKPHVYLKSGFEANDPALFGWASTIARSPSPESLLAQRITWPDADERYGKNRGLPPFALDAYRLIEESSQAQTVVVLDTSGPIVAEWSGDNNHVARLLRCTLPARWRLNALHGDPLMAELGRQGIHLELSESRLQMWRGGTDSQSSATPSLRLLDRI
jgi:GNAT superfamily N-acetyltransferase